MALIVSLAVYLAITLAVGFVGARSSGSRVAREFYVASGSLPAWVTGASLAATVVGGSATVLTATLVFKHGWAGLWLDLAGALGLAALAWGLAARVRETGACSIAELYGAHYGISARRFAAAVVVLAELAWLALLARSAVALLAPSLGLGQAGSAALLAGVLATVALYTAFGGQRAVSYTDIVQLVLMLVGLVIVAPIASMGTSPTLAPETFPLSQSLGFTDVAALFCLSFLPHLVGSDIYAKVLSASSPSAAKRGVWLAALLKLVFAIAVGLLAISARSLVPDVKPTHALSAVLSALLGPATYAVVLTALVATMMSSADQVLLSALTLVRHDILGASADDELSSHTRVLGVSLAVVPAFVLAVLLPSLLDLMKVGYTLFASGLALPLLMALSFSQREPSKGLATAAMVLGSLVGGGLHLAKLAGAKLAGQPILWGLGACLILCLLALLRSERRNSPPSRYNKGT